MTSKQPSDVSIGRPARISREAIAKAALGIGLDRITLKKISTKLGVDHSSLYRHVKNREDIIYDALDLAISEINTEHHTNNWQDYLTYVANTLWDIYAKYPGLAATIRSFDRPPLSAINAFSMSCDKIESLGFNRDDSALIIDSIIDMTTDCASAWQQLNTPDSNGKIPAQRLKNAWEQAKTHQTAAHVEYVVRIIASNPKDWWQKKLSLLIAGAEVFYQRTISKDD
ncbi:TetR/AcrR family transcriptional regulator [Vibrio salinus]|uniref:TetR/AcrR family transcriptional regulator n=1 Tax=Vibrio salinus TaxID=2899784 RepID=UPI001E2CFF91|nr:hypothetical protein [Vibrio salinus]MCE0495705.1 hypothetical protein [Vibrio salinus]